MSQSDRPKLTITFLDRRPITIIKEDWSIIASAEGEYYDGQSLQQAKRSSKWWMKIREHSDGRAIVCAGYRHDTTFLDERDYFIRGGELLGEDEDHAKAIHRVSRRMSKREHAENDERRWWKLADKCIADFPAQEVV